MPSSKITVGDLIYEVVADITSITEFGFSMESLVSGHAGPPPEGARFDAQFEGTVTGGRLQGKIRGADYLNMRADGRAGLHIHAEINTNDGNNVSLFADGVAAPDPATGLFKVSENATLTSSAPACSWVNGLQIWAQGTFNPANGHIEIKGYAA